MVMTAAERQRRHRAKHHPEILSREERHAKSMARIRAIHPEYAAKVKQLRRERKIQVLTHYGGGKPACIKCGEARPECLSIDHLNGGGTRERREGRLRSSDSFYRWLVKEGFPEGYQTLCMNCQFVKRAERGEEYKGKDTDNILHGKPIL